MLTDEDIGLAAAGEQDAVARVLGALQSRTRLMIIARLSPNPTQLDAVEDINQQVLAALVSGLGRLEHRTVVGLKSFASSILTAKVADFLMGRLERRSTAAPRSLDSTVCTLSDAGPMWQFLSASGTTPPGAAERAENGMALLARLAELKPAYRDVITLAFFDQLSTAEIAERMDVSRPAASMLLIRAVRSLRLKMMTAVQGVPEHVCANRA